MHRSLAYIIPVAVFLAVPLGAQSIHEAIRDQVTVTAIHRALPRLAVDTTVEEHRRRLGAVRCER